MWQLKLAYLHTYSDDVLLPAVDKAVMGKLFSKAFFDVISISPKVGVFSIPAVRSVISVAIVDGVVSVAIVVGLVFRLSNTNGKVTGLFPYF